MPPASDLISRFDIDTGLKYKANSTKKDVSFGTSFSIFRNNELFFLIFFKYADLIYSDELVDNFVLLSHLLDERLRPTMYR